MENNVKRRKMNLFSQNGKIIFLMGTRILAKMV